jgi:hypothetical protein
MGPGEPHDLGMLNYPRGRLHIVDMDKIKRQACECDDAINSHYSRLFANKRLPP